MKNIKINIVLGLFSLLFLASCEDVPTRTFYPHSTPVIESAVISPSVFTYGDSVTISAKVSDPNTPLSTMEMTMTVNDKVVASQIIRTPGKSTEVSAKFKVAYLSGLDNDADVKVDLKLINVEGDVTMGSVNGLKGKRKYYDRLYLVLDNNEVFTLTPQGPKSDKFQSPALNLRNSVSYKIAEKMTADNLIDFTGDVWAYQDGMIQVLGDKGQNITTKEPLKKNTEGLIFDTYAFETTLLGQDLEDLKILNLTNLSTDVTYGGENFKEMTFYIEKGREITVSSDFADVLFNLNYFERISPTKVKYLGETGPVILDYSATRKYLLVQELYPSYPTALLACGEGLGYPSKVRPEATSGWGFDQLKQFILFKKVAADTYQAIVYLDVAKANFKFFENKGWANEKRSDNYTLPSILINSETKSSGKDINGNWYAATTAVSGNYKITINLATKVVTAEAVTLP